MDEVTSIEETAPGISRRRVMGYLLAAPTLAVAVRFGVDEANPAAAVLATPDGVGDLFDLTDSQTAAAAPTANLISITVDTKGIVHFALPRTEVGQGIVTSTAMIIADEMDVPIEDVFVTLAPARPELVLNQLTGGSNTSNSMYYPIRAAAAIARGQLLTAASYLWADVPIRQLRTAGGAVLTPDGRSVTYGSLAQAAASQTNILATGFLKPAGTGSVVGRPHKRTDAHQSVTGTKVFTMDLKIPGALPTMVCRAPELNGTVRKVLNRSAVLKMPGVTHVATIPTGVAVRARTFGQCIDAVRALKVEWNDGTAHGSSDASVVKDLKAIEKPMLVPALTGITKTIDTDYTFWFAGNSALETNCAIADVRAGKAEIWGTFKAPIVAQNDIAGELGLAPSAVKIHVIPGGGSFGRRLFHDAASEAAQASKAMGVPVKLMWHRADDARVGRVHPMSRGRARATIVGGQVAAYEQRHTSARTDFSMGYGEVLTATAGKLPVSDYSLSQFVYELSQATHYNFGVTTNLLDELTDRRFNTGAMRNIYSPNAAVTRELTVDKIAAALGRDRYGFRREYTRDDRSRAVLDAVAKAGHWGRAMPPGHAQGIAIHNEYHGFTAALVEIDCTAKTVNRKVRDAITGPRVTKVTLAVDVGLVINPLGLEAQMMGGIMDGIALALTSSLHLVDGHFLEASWDNYAYTRQWNVPFDVKIIVMPSNGTDPGGAGELGVAAAFAATAAAYSRAVGHQPSNFPIAHEKPLYFTPKPFVPPIPASPTNGLTKF